MKKYQKIAHERIKILFRQAFKEFKKNPKRSHRYTQLARKIAMKAKIKIPSTLKRRFCNHCYKFLMPGSNCRVRTKNHKLIYYCLSCRKFTRIPLKATNGKKSYNLKT